jgi:hypothetical protein
VADQRLTSIVKQSEISYFLELRLLSTTVLLVGEVLAPPSFLLLSIQGDVDKKLNVNFTL